MINPEPLSAMDRAVVLGIGNPLMGDDGLGIHVARDLASRQAGLPLPARHVEILDGGTLGYLLLERLEGAEALIVVDAAHLGREPGALGVFAGADMDAFLGANPTASVHEVGLMDLMQMLALLGQTPRRRALVGVQPAVIDWVTELSPALGGSVSAASDAVVALLSEWFGASPA